MCVECTAVECCQPDCAPSQLPEPHYRTERYNSGRIAQSRENVATSVKLVTFCQWNALLHTGIHLMYKSHNLPGKGPSSFGKQDLSSYFYHFEMIIYFLRYSFFFVSLQTKVFIFQLQLRETTVALSVLLIIGNLVPMYEGAKKQNHKFPRMFKIENCIWTIYILKNYWIVWIFYIRYGGLCVSWLNWAHI